MTRPRQGARCGRSQPHPQPGHCKLDNTPGLGEGPKMSHFVVSPLWRRMFPRSPVCVSHLFIMMCWQNFTQIDTSPPSSWPGWSSHVPCYHVSGYKLGASPVLPGETSTDTTLAGAMLWRVTMSRCHDVTRCHGVTVSRPCHDTVRHNKPLLGTMPHI